MKLPRRRFLHLAAGAAALPAVSRVARAHLLVSGGVAVGVAMGDGQGKAVGAGAAGRVDAADG